MRSLASGFVIYVAMAACGASDGVVASMGGDGGSGGVVDEGGSFVDAFVDALANPVGDAKAEPLPPDVATEQCNKTGTFGGNPSNFAVHDYPGKTVEELSAVRMVAHLASVQKADIGGVYDYSLTVLNASVRAGSVAVYCGAVGGNQAYDSVTFVMPR